MRTQEAVERALDSAKAAGADGCVVLAQESTDANLRWAANTLTTNGLSRSRELTVIATVDNSTATSAGVVSRSGLPPDAAEARSAVDTVVGAAVAAARANAPAEDAQPLVAGTAVRDWDEEPATTSVGVFGDLASGLGETFRIARDENREVFGFAQHVATTTYLGTSAGLRFRWVQPTGRVELTGKSEARSRSAWAGLGTRDFTDVDVLALDAQVQQRLRWATRQVELAPGRYETLLPPSAVADLMIYVYWSASARDAYDGRTVFSRPGGVTRIGERLTDAPVTLRSDPAAPGLACQPWVVETASSSASSVFDNGVPLRATEWIRRGELTALLTTRHSAALTGLANTPGIDNLLLEGGADATRSVEGMLAGTDRGLLLTCLWYIREVDPQTLLLTGLTRDGVFLVENGEVVAGVNNFRFNESPVDMLRRLTEVGTTERTLPREWNDWFTRTAMPAVRVPDFNMSTVSDAT